MCADQDGPGESAALREAVVLPFSISADDERERGCFTCVHLWDISPRGHARCDNPRCVPIKTQPEVACTCWQRDPLAPDVKSMAEWVALHGQGLAGFTERQRVTYPTALTLQAAQEALQNADSNALAWEVKRLQSVLVRTVRALGHIAMHVQLSAMRADIQELGRLIGDEPSVTAHRQQAQRAAAKRLRG